MVDRLSATQIAGRDLPVLAGAAERIHYAEQLRDAFLEGLDDDLVEQYLAETGSNFKPRPSFSLPWSATPEGLPPGREFLVQLNDRAQMCRESAADEQVFELRCSGRRFRFPRAMRWVVEQLDTGSPRPMGRLIEAVDKRLDEETVRMLVGMLLRQGLVEIRV
jgi:hypothetical protein